MQSTGGTGGSWVSHACVGSAIVLAVTLLAGCGGRSAEVGAASSRPPSTTLAPSTVDPTAGVQGTNVPTTTAATTSAPTAVGATGLRRRDAPPAGVKEQFGFVGIGDPECSGSYPRVSKPSVIVVD